MALSIIATITATEPAPAIINFHGWRGWLGGLTAIGDRARRIGESGSVTQIIGHEAGEKEAQVWIACSSLSSFKTTCAALESLKGYTHAVTDQFGTHYNHVTVRDVIITLARATKGPAVTDASRATHRIEATLHLEVQPEELS